MNKIDDFKLFVKKNPSLLTYVKEGKMSWQKFYEIYDIYGEEDSAWSEYLKKETVKEESKKEKSRFSEILDMAKNMDADKLQDGISSVQKAIGLIGDMLVKDNTTTSNSYNPRPVYRRFDD